MNGPPDFTYQYNTRLSPADEMRYQNWMQVMSAAQGRDMSNDNRDYDMRGAFQSGVTQAANGHYPDTYKKPNHPTFSDQSQYSGVDGHQGGQWAPFGAGRWSYQASPTNVQMHGADALTDYFGRVEPGALLSLPQVQDQPAPQGLYSTAPKGIYDAQ